MARVFDDASSQYLDVGSAPVTAVPLTISAWFNRAETELDGLVCLLDADAANHYHILMLNLTGAVQARSNDGSAAFASSTANSTASIWQHGCAVFAASDDRAAYLNGGNKGTDNTDTTPNALDKTVIGGLGSGAGVFNHFNGSIAEVGIWDVALTDDEVAVLAEGYSPLLIRPQSLVMYVPLIRDDDEDLIGGLSFTANAGPTVGSHCRVIYPGMQTAGAPAAAESPSVSPSASPSVSPSVSPSASPSESPSVSPSPSPAWENYTRGDYAVLPGDDADLETAYIPQDYLDVDTKNDIRVAQTATAEYMIHQFKDFVGAANSCNLECELQTTLAPAASTVYLQIYNRNTTTWDTVDSDNGSPVNTDFPLTANIADLANYKDGSNVISCRVYQQAL